MKIFAVTNVITKQLLEASPDVFTEAWTSLIKWYSVWSHKSSLDLMRESISFETKIIIIIILRHYKKSVIANQIRRGGPLLRPRASTYTPGPRKMQLSEINILFLKLFGKNEATFLLKLNDRGLMTNFFYVKLNDRRPIEELMFCFFSYST